MNYKDKFNAQMKKAGINSLDDLKTDAEKKAFFKAVDKSHDAVNESVDEILAIAEEMKDLEPDAEEINAMVKDPHKSKEGNPKDDILAMWSKESVKADVKAKGGADMAKVQDKAEMMYAMKKINAMYKENKYLPTKDGSINDAVAQMQIAEQKTVTVRVKEFSQMVETYLARGGVKGFINAELTEGKQVLPLKEVRAFIDTYNRHFLTNYRAEEFIVRDRLNEGDNDSINTHANKPGEVTVGKNPGPNLKFKNIKKSELGAHEKQGWFKVHPSTNPANKLK